jgi:hypothetical protein
MGQVITAKASAEDILADVETTLTEARRRGGVQAREAEEFLAEVFGSGSRVLRDLRTHDRALRTARDELRWVTHQVRMVTGKVHDDLWNLLGRPRHDPTLALLFPNGASTCNIGPVAERVTKLAALAVFVHELEDPRLPEGVGVPMAVPVQALVVRLEAAIEGVKAARAVRDTTAAHRRSVGRAAQRQLARYKKILLARGFRQDEIHDLIPDRRPAAAPTKARPASTAAPGSATPPPATPPPATPPPATPPPATPSPAADGRRRKRRGRRR